MVPWEEHLIRLKFSHAVKRDSNTALKEALLRILTFCNTNKASVPPLVGAPEQSSLSHQVCLPFKSESEPDEQIIIAPPPPSEIFAPSPPLDPTRLTSPPPPASTTTTPAIATARDMTARPSHGQEREGKVRSSSPAAMGYLEQAREGFRAVRAGAGAVAGWRGRGVGQ